MMQVQPPNIGADVSKALIEVTSDDGSVPRGSIPNEAKAIRAWLKSLPKGARLAVEATGTFHRLLVGLAHGRGITVFVLNPAQLSHYARSIGRRAKTDRLDAEMIARYLAREHAELRPWQPPTVLQQLIDDLVRRRALLVKQRTALRQAAGSVGVIESAMKKLDAAFASAIATADKALRDASRQDGRLKAQAARLRQIPGIGALLAVALANRLTATPLPSADAAVAFAGLDPRTRESGTFRGRKKLSKRGDAELRRLLYMGAMTAARHTAIAPLMEAYTRRGLSAIAAYNVLARRLLRTAWSVLRHETGFDMRRFVGA